MGKEAGELIQGTLDMLVLKTLARGKMHGWGIAQHIQQSSDEVLRVEEGSLYPALHRMELDGLLDSEWGVSEITAGRNSINSPRPAENNCRKNPRAGPTRPGDRPGDGDGVKFWKKLRRRRALDRDLEDELNFHLEMSGRARFGNPTLVKERTRELWTFTTLESFWLDLSYAVRTLLKNPGVSVVAILTLALGIGANTSVFTVVNAAFTFDFGPVKPERLVIIRPGDALRSATVEARLFDLNQLRSQVKSISAVGALAVRSWNVSGGANPPDSDFGAMLSPGAFDVIGRQPEVGRVFTEADRATPVALISDRLWQNRYGRDPHMIGRSLRVDDVART